MTISQDTNRELERLDQALSRCIAGNRFDEARGIVAQCVALHSGETHVTVLSILERARRLAIVQRSLSASRLVQIQSANQYAGEAAPSNRHLTNG